MFKAASAESKHPGQFICDSRVYSYNAGGENGTVKNGKTVGRGCILAGKEEIYASSCV